MLNRLGTRQVEAMIKQVAQSKPLPAEVMGQIRVKTDGVPLFVEELTKAVLVSGGRWRETASRLPPPHSRHVTGRLGGPP
jgi:predicted ATPase